MFANEAHQANGISQTTTLASQWGVQSRVLGGRLPGVLCLGATGGRCGGSSPPNVVATLCRRPSLAVRTYLSEKPEPDVFYYCFRGDTHTRFCLLLFVYLYSVVVKASNGPHTFEPCPLRRSFKAGRLLRLVWEF